jgi:hypothetical protein
MSTTRKPRHRADPVPGAVSQVMGRVAGSHARGSEAGADQRNSDSEQVNETGGEAAQG